MGSLRVALYLLYPGLYLASSVLFLLSLFVLKWDAERVRVLENQMNQDSPPVLGGKNDTQSEPSVEKA